jgi:hypothetical protein
MAAELPLQRRTNIHHACGFYATIFLDGISHTYGFGLLSEDLLRAHTRPDEVACEAYSHEVNSAGFWPGMLPVVRGDDGDALMVAFYEPGMIFESRNILPAVEPKPFACVLS